MTESVGSRFVLPRPGSLRGRLVLSMAGLLFGGFALIAGLHALEEDGHGLGSRLGRLLLGDELPEPWQDLAVLLPFSVLVLGLVDRVCVWSLRPLLQASREAACIGPVRPALRVETEALPTEVLPLVGAVNAAMDRLAGAYEAEKRFAMNAAHELRTPLATLSLRLQRVRIDDAPFDWPGIERDITAMTARIDALLLLARSAGDHHSGGATAVLDLRRPAREAAALVLPLIERAGRALVVELPEPLPVCGDPAALRDLFRNLLENALVHGIGRIVLGSLPTGSSRAGAFSSLFVADAGSGPNLSDRDLLFERFRKERQDGPGSGLGLSIVREIARAHGGDAAFGPGPGCRVLVTLPVAEPGVS